MGRLAIVLACVVSVAAADPTYYVSHNNGPRSESSAPISDIGFLTVTGPPNARVDWNATAAQGHLRSATTVVLGSARNTEFASGRSTSGFLYDDIIFSWNGPGPAPTNFTATLNVQLAGTLSGAANNFVDPGYTIRINSSLGAYSIHAGGSGFLAGTPAGINDVDSVLQYSYANVNAGTPISLELALGASTTVFGNGSSSSLFGNSMHFVLGRAVFDVPDGITVNSVSAGIVNNRFRLPAVPEPATLGLLAVGLIAVLRRCRL